MKELDDYHRHEALDRACMLAQVIDTWLLQHPYIAARPEHIRKVGKASELLLEVYQKIGEEHL